MFDRFRQWFGRKPKYSFADDVKRQAEAQPDQQVNGALANLMIRVLNLAQWLLKGPVGRVERVTARAKKRYARLVTHRARWTEKLSDAKWVKRMAAVRAHLETETELGHLLPWIISITLLVLKGAMTVSEPIFMYTSMRVALDVPESDGLWSGNPNVWLAAASGVIMAFLLLGLTFAAARGIALTVFHAPPKGSTEYGAWTRSVLLLPRWHRATLTGVAVALLAGVTVGLHTFASGRVQGTAFNGAATASSTALVVLITALPWLIVGLGVIAEHPVLHHVSQVRRWAFAFSCKEFASVRWEAWRMTLYRRSRRLAQRGAIRLADAADRIGLRADAEVAQAGISLGTKVPEISAYTGRDKGLDAIDGKAAIAISEDNLPLSHELTEVTEQAKALPNVAEVPELLKTWSRFKAAEPLAAQTAPDDLKPQTALASPNGHDDVVNLREAQPTDLTTEGKN